MTKKMLLVFGIVAVVFVVCLIVFVAGISAQATYDKGHYGQNNSESQALRSPPPSSGQGQTEAAPQPSEDSEEAANFKRGVNLGRAAVDTIKAAADLDDSSRPAGMSANDIAVRDFQRGYKFGQAGVALLKAASDVDEARNHAPAKLYIPDGWTKAEGRKAFAPGEQLGILRKVDLPKALILAYAFSVDQEPLLTLQQYLSGIPSATQIVGTPAVDGPQTAIARLEMPDKGAIGICFAYKTGDWTYLIIGAWPVSFASGDDVLRDVFRHMFI